MIRTRWATLMPGGSGPMHLATVYPNIGAVGDQSTLVEVIGALLTITLIVACLMLIVCAAAWALAAAHGNYQSVTKARSGVLVALGGAALAGSGVAWMNFLLHLGNTL
jgi:steroid 5-alpha reductase family enzyme